MSILTSTVIDTATVTDIVKVQVTETVFQSFSPASATIPFDLIPSIDTSTSSAPSYETTTDIIQNILASSADPPTVTVYIPVTQHYMVVSTVIPIATVITVPVPDPHLVAEVPIPTPSSESQVDGPEPAPADTPNSSPPSESQVDNPEPAPTDTTTSTPPPDSQVDASASKLSTNNSESDNSTDANAEEQKPGVRWNKDALIAFGAVIAGLFLWAVIHASVSKTYEQVMIPRNQPGRVKFENYDAYDTSSGSGSEYTSDDSDDIKHQRELFLNTVYNSGMLDGERESDEEKEARRIFNKFRDTTELRTVMKKMSRQKARKDKAARASEPGGRPAMETARSSATELEEVVVHRVAGKSTGAVSERYA